MNYVFDIFLLFLLLALGLTASYFRLVKKNAYFWLIFGAATILRLTLSIVRGQNVLSIFVDLLGVALIFFLSDIFMEHRRKRNK